MGVKMLTENAGALQGMGFDVIARQAYGLNATFLADDHGDIWPGYVGAIVKPYKKNLEDEPTGYEVLDYVLEAHQA